MPKTDIYTPDLEVIKTLREALDRVNEDLKLLGAPNTVSKATLNSIIAHIRSYQPATQGSPLNHFINMAAKADADPVYSVFFTIHLPDINVYENMHSEGFNPFDIYDWLKKRLKSNLEATLNAIKFKVDFSKICANLGPEYTEFCAGQGTGYPQHPLLAALRQVGRFTTAIVGTSEAVPEAEQIRYALELLTKFVFDESFSAPPP